MVTKRDNNCIAYYPGSTDTAGTDANTERALGRAVGCNRHVDSSSKTVRDDGGPVDRQTLQLRDIGRGGHAELDA
jgi:hypothetical protein